MKQNQDSEELSDRRVHVLELLSLDGVIRAPRRAEEDNAKPPLWISAHFDAVSSTVVRTQVNVPCPQSLEHGSRANRSLP
jgi:hypothetical protein